MKKKNFNAQLSFAKKHGIEKLGLMSNKRWQEDPRGLLFSLARYKFVSKMFESKKNVLEVGCGDGCVHGKMFLIFFYLKYRQGIAPQIQKNQYHLRHCR